MTIATDTLNKKVRAVEEEDGFRPEFFADLYSLEAGNFWFRNRNALIISSIKTYFRKAESFLEIGCGTGYVLSGISKDISGLHLSGSEICEDGLSYAKKRLPDLDLFQMDARCIPFSERFDVVGAFDVIEHIEEDTLVLQQMYKACKRGIILTVPQHKWLWSHLDDYSCHKRRYARRELAAKLEEAGFEIVYATSFVTVLLPLMLLSRRRTKKSDGFDATKELKLPLALNMLLEAMLALERCLLCWQLSLPIGGSLLVVAKKLAKEGQRCQH